ncbi:MAG: galK [Actinomycetia bacterium]|nr:galK [Actinomycetes bacterium]
MTAAASLGAACAGFRAVFGRQPAGVWSAPGRVNLIGEHTDYNLGHVLPFAIDRRTYAAVALREDGIARVASALGGEQVAVELLAVTARTVSGWSAYPLGTARELTREAGRESRQGFDAYFVSDVPVGAGLSSSAAIECALALALDELWGTGLSRQALVAATCRAENDVVGAPTGILDQSASLLSHADSALFIDCADGSSETVPLGLDQAGLEILVIDTRVEHKHAAGGYRSRRSSCDRAARLLGVRALRDVTLAEVEQARGRLDDETFRRARHVVTEDARVLETVEVLRELRPRGVGPLMVASHESLREDFEVTVPELDAAVATALAAGALGARMTGGGFGGSAIALVEKPAGDRAAAEVRTAFSARGFREPTVFVATPSDGARRDT